MPRQNNGPRLVPGRLGYYVIRWTEGGDSRERSTRTRDLRSAQAVYAEFLTLLAKGHVDTPMDRLTVKAAIGDIEPEGEASPSYWHEHVIPKVAGIETARRAAKHILAHFGSMAIAEITPSHVDEYIAKRKNGRIGQRACGATVGRELCVLTAAINHAVRRKRLHPGDVPVIERPKGNPPRDRWLTLEECRALLDAAKGDAKRMPRLYRFCLLALSTASRKRAIEELRWSQIDLEHRVIDLNPPGRAQTNKRRPRVPIADDILPEIERMKREARSEYVLDHAGSIRKSFERLAAKLGWDDVTPHTLRHTWATLTVRSGVPLEQVAAVLGDSIRTVEKTYLHHCPTHLRAAVNAIRIAA